MNNSDNDASVDVEIMLERDNASSEFHRKFDELVKPMIERVREDLIEQSLDLSIEKIISQLLMNSPMFAHVLDPDYANRNDWPNGPLTIKQKESLVRIADHLGPDWAQALYHAAVFITRVA